MIRYLPHLESYCTCDTAAGSSRRTAGTAACLSAAGLLRSRNLHLEQRNVIVNTINVEVSLLWNEIGTPASKAKGSLCPALRWK